MSEVSIPSYSNDPADEEIQAELVKRLLTLWVSSKNVNSVVWWNLVDSTAHGGENVFHAGLVRNDMTPKPACKVWDELESEEKKSKYRNLFKELFNLATIPFYWSDLEPEQGKPRFEKGSPKIYRRPATDLCVEYCLENDVEPKCHCLNYDNFTLQWVRDADVKTHKKYLEKRFRELAERYGAVIPSWVLGLISSPVILY